MRGSLPARAAQCLVRSCESAGGSDERAPPALGITPYCDPGTDCSVPIQLFKQRSMLILLLSADSFFSDDLWRSHGIPLRFVWADCERGRAIHCRCLSSLGVIREFFYYTFIYIIYIRNIVKETLVFNVIMCMSH